MAEPHSHDLEETRDDLAQASLALNTAYDRLQDLRTSLRNFTAQRDRLASERARLGPRILSAGSMGPDHSAIMFSDSDEESEIDMDLLRESLPARLLELTSRWGTQHARLSAARQLASPESRNDGSSTSPRSSSDEPRPIYPPLRRRRALPQTGSSRDGVITPPGPTSPARRSILEAHLRQMRHASSPTEASTTLGRRVAQRAAAAAQASPTAEHQGPSTGAVALSDSILLSLLPPGAEMRWSTPGQESRAASHLRYSLLPNPSAGSRAYNGPRVVSTPGTAHTRLAEHRPRTARSNSLNSFTPARPATPSATQPASTLDASTQTQISPRLGQPRGTAAVMSEDDTAMRFNAMSELEDSTSGSYRVRRRINRQGEEHVFSINWGELMSEGDRDDGLSDPAAWMRPQRLPRPARARPGRVQPPQEPETDDTVVQDYVPFFVREGREGSVQRRRGWARLDADGDEISTEDEATLERTRADSRLPRARNWTQTSTSWGASAVAVLDFAHRSSRDATAVHRDVQPSNEVDAKTRQQDNNSRRVLNSMFRPADPSMAYTSPLPVSFPDKAAHGRPQEYTKEVLVILDGRIAGR